MQIAITGGTGFVGTALIRHLQAQDAHVKALARNPAKIAPHSSTEIVKGDLGDLDAIKTLIDNCDIVIHLAGVTHARNREDYFSVNRDGSARIAQAIATTNTKLIHISSLSAREPQLSPYARSKREAEDVIADILPRGQWLALRLPAIYGPGDFVTLPFFKLVKSGLAPAPRTYPPARASLLNVDDCAAAILAASENARPGIVYEVGDGSPTGHAWQEIAETLGRVLSTNPRNLPVPKPVIRLYHGALRRIEWSMGKVPSVREGQVNEFFHPDWVARENLLSEATDWRPSMTLEEGFAKTVIWYQENGLI